MDWQKFLPKEIQIEYHHNQQQNLQMLACERSSMECKAYRKYNEEEVNGIGNEVTYSRSIHAQVWDKHIIEQNG